jgi:hypothetical protein
VYLKKPPFEAVFCANCFLGKTALKNGSSHSEYFGLFLIEMVLILLTFGASGWKQLYEQPSQCNQK